MNKDLLTPADLSPTELLQLLDLASELKRNPRPRHRDEVDGLVALYFTRPATRVRLTFSAAAARLGATSVVLGPAEFEQGIGVGVDALARLVSTYASVVVATTDDQHMQRLAQQATVPVVAGLGDTHQPYQGLADLMTLRQSFGSLGGLRVAFLGDGGPLAHSVAEACALGGVQLRLATPPGRPADPHVIAKARGIALRNGGDIVVLDDAFAAVDGVDAVYSSGWTIDDGEGNCLMTTYPVTRLLLACAAPHAILLHTQPGHATYGLSRQALCDPRARIREQAENRVHCASALLATLIDRQTGDDAAIEPASSPVLVATS